MVGTRYRLGENELPKGSDLPQSIKSSDLHPYDTKSVSYRDFMRDVLFEHKFSHLSDEVKRTEHFLSDITEEQFRRVDRFHDCLVPWVSRAIDLKGKTVIEVGSGTGSSTLAFSPYVDHIHCYEISDSATYIAKERLGYFSVRNVSFENELFNRKCWFAKSGRKADVILLVAVLEHVYFSEFKEILQTAMECLNPGGVILVAETPNRLSFKDYHTSFMPFYQWLPPEVAQEYATYSPRIQFKEEMDAFAARGKIGSPEQIEHVVRWGRGVSYHDFELALGGSVHNMIALNGWEPEVRPLAPDFDDDHFLVQMFDSLGIQTNRAFARSWLYFVLKKPA